MAASERAGRLEASVAVTQGEAEAKVVQQLALIEVSGESGSGRGGQKRRHRSPKTNGAWTPCMGPARLPRLLARARVLTVIPVCLSLDAVHWGGDRVEEKYGCANEFVCQTFEGNFMAGPGCPAFVHLQPLRRSMAPCSPIMQTFSSAHALVHHHWALHGAVPTSTHYCTVRC